MSKAKRLKMEMTVSDKRGSFTAGDVYDVPAVLSEEVADSLVVQKFAVYEKATVKPRETRSQ